MYTFSHIYGVKPLQTTLDIELRQPVWLAILAGCHTHCWENSVLSTPPLMPAVRSMYPFPRLNLPCTFTMVKPGPELTASVWSHRPPKLHLVTLVCNSSFVFLFPSAGHEHLKDP